MGKITGSLERLSLVKEGNPPNVLMVQSAGALEYTDSFSAEG